MEKPARILITGASGTIGHAIALKLAKAGYDLLLHYYSQKEKAEKLRLDITQIGRQADLLQFDLSEYEEVCQRLRQPTMDYNISHFIHAGGTIDYAPLGYMKIDMIQKTLRVNLEGFFYISKALIKNMIRQRYGNIIVIGSIAGKKGFPGQSCYAASKAGLEAAVRSLANELGSYSVRVNLVAPGLIDTPFSAAIAARALEETPLKRQGTPNEVADLVAFLCSNQSSFISGATIPISGGIVI